MNYKPMDKTYDIKKVLGNNVRKLRMAKNLSQFELAELCGISPTFLNHIENGKKWVSERTMTALCTSLRVRPSVLFISEEDSTYPDPVQDAARFNEFRNDLADLIQRYQETPVTRTDS